MSSLFKNGKRVKSKFTIRLLGESFLEVGDESIFKSETFITFSSSKVLLFEFSFDNFDDVFLNGMS
jgi:hypothetical protein